MFDYAAWVRRADEFFSRLGTLPGDWTGERVIEPPLPGDRIDEIESVLRRPIPTPIREFLSTASGGCRIQFHWTPPIDGKYRKQLLQCLDSSALYGGRAICQASQFAAWQADCESSAEDLWINEHPDEVSYWTNSFPFCRTDNSDYLALDLRSSRPDPPVVYLSHDDQCRVISESFDEFLRHWEALRYVGPEIWILRQYCGRDRGLLRSDGRTAKHLRKLMDAAAQGIHAEWPPMVETKDVVGAITSIARNYGTIHDEVADDPDIAVGHSGKRAVYVELMRPNRNLVQDIVPLVKGIQTVLNRHPRWIATFSAEGLPAHVQAETFRVGSDFIDVPQAEDAASIEEALARNIALRLEHFEWRHRLIDEMSATLKAGVRSAFQQLAQPETDVVLAAWFDKLWGTVFDPGRHGHPGTSVWLLVDRGPDDEGALRPIAPRGVALNEYWATSDGSVYSWEPDNVSPDKVRALIEFEDEKRVRSRLSFRIGKRRYEFSQPDVDTGADVIADGGQKD